MSLFYYIPTMTLDKFGRHISKRARIDQTILADNVIENVEQTIISNFTKDEKYIENKIIQGVRVKVENVDSTLKSLNELVQDNTKNIKNNISPKLIKYEDDIKVLKKEVSRFEDVKNEITKDIDNKSSEIDTLRQEIFSQLSSKTREIEEIKINLGKSELDLKNVKDNLTLISSINEKIQTVLDPNRIKKDRSDIENLKTKVFELQKLDLTKINDMEQKFMENYDNLKKEVQQTAQVSRADFNATMKLITSDLNSAISSLNTKVASLEKKINELTSI